MSTGYRCLCGLKRRENRYSFPFLAFSPLDKASGHSTGEFFTTVGKSVRPLVERGPLAAWEVDSSKRNNPGNRTGLRCLGYYRTDKLSHMVSLSSYPKVTKQTEPNRAPIQPQSANGGPRGSSQDISFEREGGSTSTSTRAGRLGRLRCCSEIKRGQP